jgi:DNA ligase (NAD+)
MTEIQQLVTKIRQASETYYNDLMGPANYTDAEFDRMVDRLRELDPQNEFFSTVGAAPTDGKKVTHVTKMLSLDKCTTPAEVSKFAAKMTPTTTYTVQTKLDGSAIELVYEVGQLVSASTRGDGSVGNDILANVQDIPSIPKTLDSMNPRIVVRGECMLSFEDFAKVGGTNPRNVGNGILVRTESTNRELLTFSAYGIDVYSCYDGKPQQLSYADSMDVLKSLGFNHPITATANASTLQDVIEIVGQSREDSAFPTDGVVVQVNDFSLREQLGVGQKHPHYAFAYKWVNESAETQVLGCTLSVGHTGNIIPTLQLNPVQLNGTTVSNVLVNNFDYIAKLGVAVGDTVRVFKAGEIIPKLDSVVHKPLNRQPIEEPSICPVCEHATNKGHRGAMTKCLNPACSAQAVGKVKRWVKSLDILGIGDELLAEMQCTLDVNTPLDLYTLTEDALSPLVVGTGFFGASRAKAILSEIQAKGKNLTIDEFLGSLGISFLGKRRVQIIREKADGALDTVEAWLDGSTLFKMASRCSIGGTVSTINKELQDNVLLIENLLKHVSIRTAGMPAALGAPYSKDASDALDGAVFSATLMETPSTRYVFVLTGAMSKPRKDIAADIESAGHVVKDAVAKGVTHLVQSDPSSQSSKTKKATSLGIQIISEMQLQELIK